MLFNSLHYAIFLPVIFGLYWLIPNKKVKLQNLLLFIASYFFYACWDWRFLFLLAFSTALDYYTGLRIHNAETSSRKKFWLWTSIGVNLGFLGFFKYYNFFISSFSDAFNGMLGMQMHPWTLSIILPVGISFYTFHGLSYVLDIYFDRIKPERNAIDYAVFVSFFPLLVAGPIERATHLLPQIKKKREFEYAKAVDGLRQILWGMFKKVVIADNCAEIANRIFDHPGDYTGGALLLGAVLFAFQIYGDFSGYSDIALGSARLFGIELLRNFAFPYFSRDIAEFWRRWHISLSSWFRDYLYIPLGGSRGGIWMKIRNTFAIFVVSGFWHGANWTFLAWGFLNAVYFLPLMLMKKNRENLEVVAKGRILPSVKETFAMAATFFLTIIAWVFFRAKSMGEAFSYLSGMFSGTLFNFPNLFASTQRSALLVLIIAFLVIEWLGRERQYALADLGANWRRPYRWAFYYCLILMIYVYTGKHIQFIYFQF